MLLFLKKLFAWFQPHKKHVDCVRETRAMRENMSERQLDKMLKDSFPASDPPAY